MGQEDGREVQGGVDGAGDGAAVFLPLVGDGWAGSGGREHDGGALGDYRACRLKRDGGRSDHDAVDLQGGGDELTDIALGRVTDRERPGAGG